MIRAFYVLIFFFLIGSQFSAIGAANQKLTALFSHAQFFSKEQGPYFETYLNILGSTVSFVKTDQGKQGSIEVSIAFLQNDTIRSFKKYNLLSPVVGDTGATPNFIDVQRFALAKGEYKLELKVKDNNSVNPGFSYEELINIDLDTKTCAVSGIQLLDRYTKSEQASVITKGQYEMVPMVSNFFHKDLNDLKFYTEFYNLQNVCGDGSPVVVNAYIENFENGIKVPGFFRFFRKDASSTIPLLSSFPLKDLPTGNYNLVVEARNKENELLADRKIFFQRANPNVLLKMEDLIPGDIANTFVEKIKSRDSLVDYLRSLRPISSQTEIQFVVNLLKNGDELAMRRFFLGFWQQRDMANPELKWNVYKEHVDYVNKVFKTQTRPGYATDRGRVYLQYGKPDNRYIYDREPSMYPYEIWQFYQLTGKDKTAQRNNRRFIFSNQDLVTNDYLLIHSDAIGEVRDDRWQVRLQKRNNAINDFDMTRPANSHFGTNIDDIMNMSR